MSLILLAFLVLDPILRSWVKRDLAGAVPQEGQATVEILVLPPANTVGFDASPQLSVRFRSQLCSVKNVRDAARMRQGQPVQIEYRIGKSGRFYVDSAQPLPPDTPVPPTPAASH